MYKKNILRHKVCPLLIGFCVASFTRGSIPFVVNAGGTFVSYMQSCVRHYSSYSILM